MCSEPGNERTRPLLEQFLFSTQEPVGAVFGSPETELRMRVIFQADEKHVIQVLLIRKCDNIKHILFKKIYEICVLCSVEDSVRL